MVDTVPVTANDDHTPAYVVLDSDTGISTGSSTPLLVSCGVIACLTLCSITLLSIFHPGDNTQLITTIIGFSTLSATSLTAILKGNQNSTAIKKLHLAVNGRLSQLLSAMAKNATLAANNVSLTTQVEKKDQVLTAITDTATGGVTIKVPVPVVIAPTGSAHTTPPNA